MRWFSKEKIGNENYTPVYPLGEKEDSGLFIIGTKTVRGSVMKPLKKHLSIQLLNGRYSSETNFEIAEYNCFIADQICFLKGCDFLSIEILHKI